jgi:hypothetical protein
MSNELRWAVANNHEKVDKLAIYVIIDLYSAWRLVEEKVRSASEDLHVGSVRGDERNQRLH